MLIVAGLSLKNLKPRVWNPESPYYIPEIQAVMVSYADFHQMPSRRRAAMEQGLHEYLGIPRMVRVYLDNGAFYFLNHGGETPRKEYEEFVARALPDWYPIPQDFIPTPQMTREEQRQCFQRTMAFNRVYQQDGYVPVVHVSQFLKNYLQRIQACDRLRSKPAIALGGLVPNLLRASKAIPYTEVLDSLKQVREAFANKEIHVFGVGGTATLHIAALIGMDSVDSSGWRNRAARGIVQLPGSGDRMTAQLGKWKVRSPRAEEWERLSQCPCPACQQFGPDGLKADGIEGSCNRATHNLWVLLQEANEIRIRLANGTYAEWYEHHLDNSIYLPLIRYLCNWQTSL